MLPNSIAAAVVAVAVVIKLSSQGVLSQFLISLITCDSGWECVQTESEDEF